MAINFPNSPSNGDTTTLANKTYTYDSSKSKWSPSGAVTLSALSVGSEGTAAGDGAIAYNGAGVFSFTPAVAAGTGVTVHANQAAMTATSPDEGSLHYVTADTKLYVKMASGFYLLATVSNVTPTITGLTHTTDGTTATIADAATFTLTSGQNTVITLAASDPDVGQSLTYSATLTAGTLSDVASGFTQGSGADVNKFTIVPQTSGSGGTLTYRFDVTDGVGTAQRTASFSISFIILNSRYTSLLMNVNSAGTNSSFTNSGSGSSAVKGATNNPSAGTFSPFRAGGYSVEFDGNDYLKVADSNDFHVSSSADFTLEAWIYLTSNSDQMLLDPRPSGSNGDYMTMVISTLKLMLYSQTAVKLTSAASVSLNQWVHVAYVRASNTGRWYINGTADTNTWTDNIAYHTSASGADWWIGARQLSGAGSYFSNAKIRDFRFVNGTAIVPPSGGPAEPLTAVTNTKLLACSLPNFADANTQVAAKTITISGDPRTVPNGPYDVGETQLSGGGSIHFDAVGTSGHADAPIEIAAVTDGGANHTVSFWYYFTGTGTSGATSKGNIYTYGDEQGNVGYGIQHNNANNGQIIFMYGTSPYETVLVTSGAKHSQWNYLQVIKTGTTVRCYLNGVLGTGSGSRSSDYANGAAELNIGAERYGGMSNLFRGYISDLQYINSASTDYSVPTALRSSSGTVVHLKGETASISDKSQRTNLALYGGATGHATTKIANAFSVEFDGADDYISLNNQGIGNFGTEDFTAECWFNSDDIANYRNIMGTRINAGNSAAWCLAIDATGKIYVYSAAYIVASATSAVSANTWYYVSYSRDGANHRLHLGTSTVSQVATATTVRDYTADNFAIGKHAYSASEYFNGNIQNLRITKGLARYSASSYTAPTTLWKG